MNNYFLSILDPINLGRKRIGLFDNRHVMINDDFGKRSKSQRTDHSTHQMRLNGNKRDRSDDSRESLKFT